jgi:hypothetical protein
MSYSYIYAPKEDAWQFYEMGIYAVLFYISHVVVIFFVSNLIFWLKAINPRFKEGSKDFGSHVLSISHFVSNNRGGCKF